MSFADPKPMQIMLKRKTETVYVCVYSKNTIPIQPTIQLAQLYLPFLEDGIVLEGEYFWRCTPAVTDKQGKKYVIEARLQEKDGHVHGQRHAECKTGRAASGCDIP
jgi:hypothetical protein